MVWRDKLNLWLRCCGTSWSLLLVGEWVEEGADNVLRYGVLGEADVGSHVFELQILDQKLAGSENLESG